MQAAGLEELQGVWEPVLPGLIILLPLLGFAVNSVLALSAASKSAAAVRAGREFDFFENGRPTTHSLPTWVGPGVMLLAFLLTIVNFVGMLGAELHEPVIRSYWSWITTGEDFSGNRLDVAAAIHLDQLSMIMMMIITGVGFLIHVFSVGYMRDDPGYPRYFAYLNLFVFFMAGVGHGSQLSDHVHRLGGCRAVLVPPDRILVQRRGEGFRREEGVHREPNR